MSVPKYWDLPDLELFKLRSVNSSFVKWNSNPANNGKGVFTAFWAGYEAAREAVRTELVDQGVEYLDCSKGEEEE